MASPYGLDEDTKKLLTLDNFLGDLTVREFVDRLSKQNVQHKSRLNNGVEYLDPKPYIRTFELVQKELDKLSSECQSEKTRAEKRSRKAAAVHAQEVEILNENAASLNQRFNRLADSASRLHGGSIGPVGEKLAKANDIQDHTQQLMLLSRCYNELYQGKVPDQLVRYSPKEMGQTARLMRQLVELSTKLGSEEASLPKVAAARQTITKLAQNFESDQLDNFSKYYDKGDVDKTSDIARIMFEFNGGKSLIDLFIERSPMFGELTAQMEASQVPQQYWVQLGDPNFRDYELDKGTAGLLHSAAVQLASSVASTQEIFQSHSDKVVGALVSRLFQQIIRQRVSYLLNVASSYSKMAYLRILQLVSAEVYQTFVNTRDDELSPILEKASADLFLEYLADDNYFTVEKENLLQLLDAFIPDSEPKHALTERMTAYKEGHEDTYTRLDEELSSPASPTGSSFKARAKKLIPYSKRLKKFTSTSVANSGWREKLKRTMGSSSKLSPSTVAEIAVANVARTAAAHDVAPLEATEQMLNYVVESLNRSIELFPSKVNDYSMDIFEILLYKLGNSYIMAALDNLYYEDIVTPKQKLTSFFGSGGKVNLDFISQINTIAYQLYLLSIVVKKSFYPLLLSESVKSKLVGIFNSYFQDAEIGLNITLNTLVELVDETVKVILNSQSSDDFSPRNQNVVIDKTETCEKLITFVDYALKTLHSHLESNASLEYELVSRITNLLLEDLIVHFTKYPVNSTGSLMLTQDVIHYISTLENYDFDALRKKLDSDQTSDQIESRFQVLKELTNLFSCQPELLKDLSNEGQLTSLKRSVLRRYIQQRVDFSEQFLNGI